MPTAQFHDSRGALEIAKEAVAKLGQVFKMLVDSGYRGGVSAWLEARRIEVVISTRLTPGRIFNRRALYRLAHTTEASQQRFGDSIPISMLLAAA